MKPRAVSRGAPGEQGRDYFPWSIVGLIVGSLLTGRRGMLAALHLGRGPSKRSAPGARLHKARYAPSAIPWRVTCRGRYAITPLLDGTRGARCGEGRGKCGSGRVVFAVSTITN